MTVFMMYPGWQLRSTTLAVNCCSKARRLDVLPRMAPAWLLVSEHEHSVCEKCQVQLVNTLILEMTALSWWREELPGRRGLTILKENPVDETKEMCVLRVDLWWRSITPFGGDRPVPSGLPVVPVHKGSEAHQSHSLSQTLPGTSPPPPSRKPLCTDYSRPMVLNQVTRCPLPHTLGTFGKCPETLCYCS